VTARPSTGPRLAVRPATPADAAPIAEVMRTAIRVLARATYPPRVLALWSSLPPLYHAWAMSAGGETYLVAERDGRIDGYAALHGREVTAVFVRPEAARQGVGRALLARVEDLAAANGERTLVVRSSRGAVPFYEAAGYAAVGPTWVPLFDGVDLAAVRLRKRLEADAADGGALSAAGRHPRSSGARRRPRGATRTRRAAAS
jgi:putative acetyltransferase